MTVVVLVASGCGVGIIGLVVALRRSTPSLEKRLAGLLDHSLPDDDAAPLSGDLTKWRVHEWVGVRVARSARIRGLVRAEMRSATIVTGTSFEKLCSQVVLAGTAGFLLPSACWAIMKTGGVALPLFVPVSVGVAGCAAGASFPLLVIRAETRRFRRQARMGVGAFLNLVVLCLAGGMGIESALAASAQVSEDEVFKRIAAALSLAQEVGDPPWDALARLGLDLGVAELEELASAIGLAGTEGARIRATLAAKSGSIRRRELADAEAEANSVTERLFVPGIFMLIGFLLFIGYPAFARISLGF